MKMRLLKTILVSVIAFGILFTQSGTNVNAQENEGKCKIIFDGNGGKLYGYDYISVDGGGTKTRVCCCSLDGAEIETRTFGAFNINSIGLEKFRTLLSDITAFLKSVGECSAVCIGSAGISNEVMADAVSDAMKDAGIRNWKLVGDNVIALAGALDGGAGIILIAGTGSICFGRGRNGEEARSGGWGHLIGDEGSAYALGRDALSAVARAMDGYGKQTMLTSLLASELGLDTRSRIISYMKSSGLAFRDLEQYLPYYPDRLFRNLYEVGLLNGLSS